MHNTYGTTCIGNKEGAVPTVCAPVSDPCTENPGFAMPGPMQHGFMFPTASSHSHCLRHDALLATPCSGMCFYHGILDMHACRDMIDFIFMASAHHESDPRKLKAMVSNPMRIYGAQQFLLNL